MSGREPPGKLLPSMVPHRIQPIVPHLIQGDLTWLNWTVWSFNDSQYGMNYRPTLAVATTSGRNRPFTQVYLDDVSLEDE